MTSFIGPKFGAHEIADFWLRRAAEYADNVRQEPHPLHKVGYEVQKSLALQLAIRVLPAPPENVSLKRQFTAMAADASQDAFNRYEAQQAGDLWASPNTLHIKGLQAQLHTRGPYVQEPTGLTTQPALHQTFYASWTTIADLLMP